MTTDTEDLTIEPEATPTDEVIVADAPAKIIKPEEGIEELRAQLEAERAKTQAETSARLSAEQRANEASAAAASSANAAQDSDLALVTNAIGAVKQSQDLLKSQYRDALAAQDFDRASEINAEMTTNAAKMLRLEEGKTALETRPKVEARRIVTTDPLEQIASTLSPRSAAWLRAHPEFARDPIKTQRMIAAHNLATTDGLRIDSDEYFAAIEDTLKIKPPAAEPVTDESALSEAAAPAPRRAAPPAAPVTRGAGAQTVRLSAEEREMAEMMGMSPQDYAKNKLDLQREGKLN